MGFAAEGAGQWLRYLVGSLEVAGAVGLMVPRLSGLAALWVAGLMVGATTSNLFVLGESPWLPSVSAGRCGRRSQCRHDTRGGVTCTA